MTERHFNVHCTSVLFSQTHPHRPPRRGGPHQGQHQHACGRHGPGLRAQQRDDGPVHRLIAHIQPLVRTIYVNMKIENIYSF